MQYDVCVVGLGYIGLPTAILLADSGLKTLGVDINAERVNEVRSGSLEISEPGLSSLLRSALQSEMLEVSTSLSRSSAFLIAVPTPLRKDRTADLTFLRTAVDSITPFLEQDNLIAIESTCPAGTTLSIEERVYSARPELAGHLKFAYCPERILPGDAISELRSNDRTIGGTTDNASRAAASLYESFCEGNLFVTDATSAEMVKLTENAYRDVNIAFANEISLIADQVGVNPWEVISLANKHPRVNILKPGPGVGGHCIAVDPWFLVESAPYQAEIIRTAREVNDLKPQWVIAKAEERIDSQDPKNVAILGLSFKPDIDDLRESPALQIARELAKRNPQNQFIAVEPNISDAPKQLEAPNITWSREVPPEEELQLVIWLVDHKDFKNVEGSLSESIPILDACGTRTRPAN